ncbi:MAG: hypothetical protein MMC23_010014 [Stictis urceolatum]|nr:hypothetical protein [Stictis urceolata]
MVTTRSTQQSNSHSPTCTQKSEPAAGSKRKAEASPSQITKRRKTISDSDQPQKTLEESFGHAQFPQADKTAPASERGTSKPSEQISKELESHCSNSSTQSAGEQNSHDSKSAIRTSARDDSMPDSVLEKGLIYFFFRGRVGIDEPSATDDVARSYIVLRPIPLGAAIESGHVDPECASYRVLALPKKIFPGSARDQFMLIGNCIVGPAVVKFGDQDKSIANVRKLFVEHAAVDARTIKERVLNSADYTTKTAGVRHTPSAKPIGEGVYAFVKTEKDTRLAYMLTLPEELGEVHHDMRLHEKGSFICSAKNPQYGGPSNASLPEGASFSREILDEFRSRRWAPLQPRMLDYKNAQILLIGSHAAHRDLKDITRKSRQDREINGDGPVEELERLEEEDESRLGGFGSNESAPIFADLALSQEQFSGLQTGW